MKKIVRIAVIQLLFFSLNISNISETSSTVPGMICIDKEMDLVYEEVNISPVTTDNISKPIASRVVCLLCTKLCQMNKWCISCGLSLPPLGLCW